jgi:hypothetical protein
MLQQISWNEYFIFLGLGTVVYYGWWLATASPLTDSSIFRIASISKSFSATAIMQLVEAKKLSFGGYGLAIETKQDLIPGKTMKGHTGSAYGLYSIMFWQPKEKFGIVAITNGINLAIDDGYNDVTKDVANILYSAFIK